MIVYPGGGLPRLRRGAEGRVGHDVILYLICIHGQVKDVGAEKTWEVAFSRGQGDILGSLIRRGAEADGHGGGWQGLSRDIHTDTPARKSSTNFQLCYFVTQMCSTNCLGHTPGLHHKISVFLDPDPGKS